MLRFASGRDGTLCEAEAFTLNAAGTLAALPQGRHWVTLWDKENLVSPAGQVVDRPLIEGELVAVQFGPGHELTTSDYLRLELTPELLPGGQERVRLCLYADQTRESLIAAANGLAWISADRAWKAKEVVIAPPGYVYNRFPLPEIVQPGARQRLSPLAHRAA